MGKNGLMCFMFHCEAFVRKSEDRNWCVQFKKIRYYHSIVIGKEVVFTAYKEVGRGNDITNLVPTRGSHFVYIVEKKEKSSDSRR